MDTPEETQKTKSPIGQRIMTIVIIVALIAGVGLLAYPTVSDWWNSFHQSRAIEGYVDAVNELSQEEYERVWNDAKAYNKTLLNNVQTFELNEKQLADYRSQLNIEGNGIMGYIEVPVINVKLPLYHGTDESVLQTAIGHIEGSSLPVGGESTHCVVSGHRGLPSATLFTNLDKVQEGDLFMFHILNETLTYEVDQIRIVEPYDTKDLQIVAGKDLATMVTCTPYGINSHRMLVRGHRVPNVDGDRVASEAEQVNPIIVAAFVGIPILFIILLLALLFTRRKKSISSDEKANLTGKHISNSDS